MMMPESIAPVNALNLNSKEPPLLMGAGHSSLTPGLLALAENSSDSEDKRLGKKKQKRRRPKEHGEDGEDRPREHPFIVTEPGEAARGKKNGLDYLFDLYEQCGKFLEQVQQLAREKGEKCPTKVTNQVFRHAKHTGAGYINKPKMRHYVHCYALHCLDIDQSNALRKLYKERGENVGAWRGACYYPLVAMARDNNWDIEGLFNRNEKLRICVVDMLVTTSALPSTREARCNLVVVTEESEYEGQTFSVQLQAPLSMCSQISISMWLRPLPDLRAPALQLHLRPMGQRKQCPAHTTKPNNAPGRSPEMTMGNVPAPDRVRTKITLEHATRAQLAPLISAPGLARRFPARSGEGMTERRARDPSRRDSWSSRHEMSSKGPGTASDHIPQCGPSWTRDAGPMTGWHELVEASKEQGVVHESFRTPDLRRKHLDSSLDPPHGLPIVLIPVPNSPRPSARS
ncbi:hypothetical protein AXG93_2584s1340 [Marchantia polymorpha subsp. ruderalis]|uniref:Floricaula/leafy-like transcription factor n=1 Tax=Marchantia polymorpha subsp. ruderalis TaxID=1480154 RepID=A0A176VGR8_MARPO|nr:hypothetical protein AXG93_2584s1340 [Marchantia polymorpha subsp. ruderalis]